MNETKYEIGKTYENYGLYPYLLNGRIYASVRIVISEEKGHVEVITVSDQALALYEKNFYEEIRAGLLIADSTSGWKSVTYRCKVRPIFNENEIEDIIGWKLLEVQDAQ